MFGFFRRRRQTFTSYLGIIFILELVLLFSGVLRISVDFNNVSLNPAAIIGLLILALIAIGELWEW